MDSNDNDLLGLIESIEEKLEKEICNIHRLMAIQGIAIFFLALSVIVICLG